MCMCYCHCVCYCDVVCVMMIVVAVFRLHLMVYRATAAQRTASCAPMELPTKRTLGPR